jgi:hypothetical protein
MRLQHTARTFSDTQAQLLVTAAQHVHSQAKQALPHRPKITMLIQVQKHK